MMKTWIVGALVGIVAVGTFGCGNPVSPDPTPTSAPISNPVEEYDEYYCGGYGKTSASPINRPPTGQAPAERVEFDRLIRRWLRGGLSADQNDDILDAIDALSPSLKPPCER